jgi:hypothetical protein
MYAYLDHAYIENAPFVKQLPPLPFHPSGIPGFGIALYIYVT